MRARGIVGALIVAVTAGCSQPKPITDPEQERIDRLTRRLVPELVTKGFSYALAAGDCGPTDLPAMSLYLLDDHEDAVPPRTQSKYIRVRVFLEPAALAHERVEWRSSRGPGVAELCLNGSCDAMTDGYIDFGDVNVGHSIEGELDLRFTNDVRVRKRFGGHWSQRPVICGPAN